jgi:hypothetical protein
MSTENSLYQFHSIYVLYLYHFISLSSHVVENEIQQLRFQSSDDVNDLVKYIAAINDKVTQMEVLQQNQLNYTE